MVYRSRGLYQLVLMVWCVGTLTAAVFDASTESKFLSYVEDTMKCRTVPGLTVAVVKDNATWTHGFGTADFDTGRLVDGKSLFGIGSLTKAFTMTLLAGLLEENGFAWTSKLSDVLGYELKFIDDLRTKEMTIRDLLSHRTGLARLDFGLFAGRSRNSTTREGFCRTLQYLPAEHEFRDQFIYNNYMYTLLGHVCEKLGGDTWENLVKTKLLTPIGMTSTSILMSPRDLKRRNVAKPYYFDDGEFRNGTQDLYNIFPTEPAGAILSSSEDMAKWIKFNLNRGKTEDGKQLIKEEMFAEAVKTTSATDGGLMRPTFPVAHVTKGYGYAWGTSNYRGYEMHQHSGGLVSYITMLWIFPELNTGLFTGVNGPAFKSQETLDSIMYYLSDVMMGETPWLNKTTACTFPEPWMKTPQPHSKPEDTHSLSNGQDYEGVYRNDFLPDIKVSAQNDSSNVLTAESGSFSLSLLPTKDHDRFLMEVAAPWELVRMTTDDNNVTVKTNVTFKRDAGTVHAAVFGFEVNVTYNKWKPDSGSMTNSALSVNELTFGAVLILQIFWTMLVFR